MRTAFPEDAEFNRMLAERLKSREWWVLIPLGPEGDEKVQQVEFTYYINDAARDFEAVLTPGGPVFCFYLAKKEHMAARQIAEVMRPDIAEELERELEEKDLVFMGQKALPENQIIAHAFSVWLLARVLAGTPE